MRTEGVVLLAPRLGQRAPLVKAAEGIVIEDFLPIGAIAAFDLAVLSILAGFDPGEPHRVLLRRRR